MEESMAVKRYDPAVKTAFSKAATDARKAGKTWAEAFEAAKEAGYKGTAGGLQQLLYVKPTKRRGRKPRGKAGRPAGRFAGLDAMIEAEVKRRIRDTLQGIIQNIKAKL